MDRQPLAEALEQISKTPNWDGQTIFCGLGISEISLYKWSGQLCLDAALYSQEEFEAAKRTITKAGMNIWNEGRVRHNDGTPADLWNINAEA